LTEKSNENIPRKQKLLFGDSKKKMRNFIKLSLRFLMRISKIARVICRPPFSPFFVPPQIFAYT